MIAMKPIRIPPSSVSLLVSVCFLALVIILMAGGAGPARAESIQLRPAEGLKDENGNPLLPGTPAAGYAIPCVTDWNGDGKTDLLVGYQSAGKIACYLNSGTAAQPHFTSYSNLKAGVGSDICHISGGCGAPAPWVCDFDGDGKRDLLVGAGADGTVWFYRNTNTDAAPTLDTGVQLRVGGLVLNVGVRATPFVHDWDQDGLNDLLCGSGDGSIYFFKNSNSNPNPVYAPGVKIQAGGADVSKGIRSVARVLDWDGDGLKDLLLSSDTGVFWCRNTNNNSQPVLMVPQAICAPVSGSGLVPINTGGRMRLDLVDWNGDGVTDIVLGNLYGTVNYYEGYHLRIRRLERDPAQQITLEWDSAPFVKYHVWTGSSINAITNRAATNLPAVGKTILWTNQPAQAQSRQFYRVQLAQ